MKHKLSIVASIILSITVTFAPLTRDRASATSSTSITDIVASMTTEQKIASMIMPSFRWSCNDNHASCPVTSITPEIQALLEKHNFAGIILFGQNTTNTEQTVRLIDALQSATAANTSATSQLLIATDQEGGYITRLAYGTKMPGNMALGATNDPSLSYAAASVIGSELAALGINTDFAPVTDVNNNPANPVIGIRSFSDDPFSVGEYASAFMRGLNDNSIIASLKHFPGHGDTSTDTHSSLTIVDKSYDELKSLELIPFQRLIDDGVELLMTAHIQYPALEPTTYTSKNPNTGEITLPATLSKAIITDLLRNDMGYNGVVITDALNMGAIAQHFDRLDIARLAINAGVDILLEPVETDSLAGLTALDEYITDVAALVDSGDISISNVDAAVTRILTLKSSHNLLTPYSSDVDSRVASALSTVSSKAHHDLEFDIATHAITVVKNEDDILPIPSDKKTLILYEDAPYRNAANYALTRLVADGKLSSTDHIKLLSYIDDRAEISTEILDADNIIIINAMWGYFGDSLFDSPFSANIDSLITEAHAADAKVIYLSTQLPYDIARFNTADALALAYYTSSPSFTNLAELTSNIPAYGANVMAAIYQFFDSTATITGRLPVNIYALNNDYSYSNDILYPRGFGLSYSTPSATDSADDLDTPAPSTPDTSIVHSHASVNSIITSTPASASAIIITPLATIILATTTAIVRFFMALHRKK